MKTLIVGAGPTGLSAALQLASHGLSCRIVEQRTKASELSRAIGITPSTIDALRPLGAADAIIMEAMHLQKVDLYWGKKRLMQLDIGASGFKDQMILGLPQDRTEEILRETLAAKGVEVEYGVSVENIATDESTATVTFSDGTTESHDWVVAADGIHSKCRKSLGIGYPGYDLPEVWSIADVDLAEDFDSDRVNIQLHGRSGSVVITLPMEKHRVRVVSATPDALAALSAPLPIINIRRTATFTISVRQAESYVRGRVLLAGDAAHCHSPVGGRGMNLGIADAVAAGKAIAEGTVPEYSDARHREGKRILQKTEAARKLITSHAPWNKALVYAAAMAINSLPPARNAFLRSLTQL
ncbi:NAD(P)/FAD-dependent oxidoreductase [Roseibium sp. RKSG952]|uniref:FAD-dependent oxidoreductase n=1 Tax=Roseibium sp. RKSG952 TaxID=2529384 RepID=UPI0018AD115D|nr:NAD(P)/FAD-dependent oxidoreductase [Roseibium sp. RKSG952]